MFKIVIDKKASNYIQIRLSANAHDFKGQFGIRTIANDDIDSVCDARAQPEVNYLCKLSDGTVGIIEDVSYDRKAKLGAGVMIAKYNKHPLVAKGAYPLILRHIAITSALIEGIVICGNIDQYFAK